VHIITVAIQHGLDLDRQPGNLYINTTAVITCITSYVHVTSTKACWWRSSL